MLLLRLLSAIGSAGNSAYAYFFNRVLSLELMVFALRVYCAVFLNMSLISFRIFSIDASFLSNSPTFPVISFLNVSNCILLAAVSDVIKPDIDIITPKKSSSMGSIVFNGYWVVLYKFMVNPLRAIRYADAVCLKPYMVLNHKLVLVTADFREPLLKSGVGVGGDRDEPEGDKE